MKIEDAIKMETEAHERRMKIRSKKAHDYAKKDEDALANFKVMADLADALAKHGYAVDITKPQGVAMWHEFHKLVRILNLWNEDIEPENESLEDNFDDASNYLDLAKECYVDYKKKE